MVAFGRPFYHGGLINRRTVLRAALRPARLPPPRRERAEAEPDPRVRPPPHHGLAQRPGARDRGGGDRGDRRADHLRRGRRPHRLAPRARPPRRDRLGLARRDRHAAEQVPRRGRAASPAGPASTTRAATRARCSSTPSGLSRPRRWTQLAAERGIDLAASYAYTDSYTDLPMLEAVGHPVAVNPDRVLNRYAREHDFEVLHFSQTVSLWSRVRDRFGVGAAPAGDRGVGGRGRPRGRRRRRGLVAGLAQARQLSTAAASEGLSRPGAASRRWRPGRRAAQVSRLLDHARS